MDKKKLRELINLFKESGLAKMEITENSAEENYSLKLESGAAELFSEAGERRRGARVHACAPAVYAARAGGKERG